MQTEDIARYLAGHPEFFDQHPHLLTDIRVSHPFDGRAVSIAERQILNLREKYKLLETKLAELIKFGEENDAIAEKMHHLSRALMTVRELPTLLQVLKLNLHEDFGIPHVALRIWHGSASLAEFAAVSEAVKNWSAQTSQPHCGTVPMDEMADWFAGASLLRSFAAVPLQAEHSMGVLVLASEDAQRFYPQMGTLYLQRLGELLAAALQRLLP
ncbi:protein of unknown function DUF484 [Sulfuriferula multivorans]|uniref:DUF484 family protein n=1 Tax=Sulfuriferula multivorans TaxID=1559896 RepID=A0A401JBD4_9PROT|nr:DUF484 family protein [Sulfuriferula multivorans]GBL44884.1 protein of unknown function DUF484 [Sulfuriferula multivorans]